VIVKWAACSLGALLTTAIASAGPPLPLDLPVFDSEPDAPSPGASARPAGSARPFVPAIAAPSAVVDPAPRGGRKMGKNGCSDDMVRVAGFCIDRFEASLVDDDTGEALSPYYPPNPSLIRAIWTEWNDRITDGTAGLLDIPLPPLPARQIQGSFRPRAVSRRGAVPSGYMTKTVAAAACAAAGKRLCSLDEWVRACKGQRDEPFPYGPTYRKDVCNVFRDEHPGHLLHDSFSEDLLDPRMNQVSWQKRPLLAPTGTYEACRSRWGADGAYDMVGNLDEWVEADVPTFAGGFYARATRNGCDAKVSSHGPSYFDYSTGARCCDKGR
jgi:hypothetical protein